MRSLSQMNMVSATKRIVALMVLVALAVVSLSVTVNAVLYRDCDCGHVCKNLLLDECAEKCVCPVELCSACEAVMTTNKTDDLRIENNYIKFEDAICPARIFIAGGFVLVKTDTIVDANVRMNN